MSDKAKLSLLEYENSFLKEELKNKQLMVEKVLDLNSDRIHVHKPSEQSTIHKINITNSKNEINRKKFNTYHKKTPKAPIRENRNRPSNVNNKRTTVIGDSMVKSAKSGNPGCNTEDIADYIKPIIRRKPDITLVHTGTNILQAV